MEYVETLYTQTILGQKRKAFLNVQCPLLPRWEYVSVFCMKNWCSSIIKCFLVRWFLICWNIFKCLVPVEGGSVASLWDWSCSFQFWALLFVFQGLLCISAFLSAPSFLLFLLRMLDLDLAICVTLLFLGFCSIRLVAADGWICHKQ